ncbi:hypothetical protein GE09DRAFT_651494 [Coniochaeta sp. 2T2.1]|nr:hypothetical protein GE09DRAFT_651494 [Coniochaeta sp. 2T2.1]
MQRFFLKGASFWARSYFALSFFTECALPIPFINSPGVWLPIRARIAQSANDLGTRQSLDLCRSILLGHTESKAGNRQMTGGCLKRSQAQSMPHIQMTSSRRMRMRLNEQDTQYCVTRPDCGLKDMDSRKLPFRDTRHAQDINRSAPKHRA